MSERRPRRDSTGVFDVALDDYGRAAKYLVGGLGELPSGARALVAHASTHARLAHEVLDACRRRGARAEARELTRSSSAIEGRLAGVDASVFLGTRADTRAADRLALVQTGDSRRHVHAALVDEPKLVWCLARLRREPGDTLGEALRRAVEPAEELRASSSGGADLVFGVEGGWSLEPDALRGPGAVTAPGGELVACPSRIEGVFVADRGLSLSDGHAIGRADAARLVFEIRDGRLASVSGPSEAASAVLACCDSAPNGRRVGQVFFGTNPWLVTSMGVPDVDAKAPGLGLAFGYTAPARTGASWSATVSVQALCARASVYADGRAIAVDGRYRVS